MAETQEASIGWGGEVWLSTDATEANLDELVQVVSFTLPNDQTDRVETTHLKSAGKRREYTGGMIDGGEVTITLNFRPGSDTDAAIEDAKDEGDERAIRFNVPHLGLPAWTYDTTGIVTGYDRGEVTPDGKMEATVTVALTGGMTSAAYVAP
jgi:hypothetical protein